MSDENRKAFEAWYSDQIDANTGGWKRSDGKYASGNQQLAWHAWQAATAAALERAAVVCDAAAQDYGMYGDGTTPGPTYCAEAIRALKEQP